MIVDTEEYRGFTICIHQDEVAESPREAFDELGHMACWHYRYELGDPGEVEDGETPVQWLNRKLVELWEMPPECVPAWEDGVLSDTELLDQGLEALAERAIVLHLYLLDHSGLWMRTKRFREDPQGWDTSYVGWIYLPLEEVRQEYGEISDETIERATRVLEREVETYSMYLSGCVYGYTLEPLERNKEITCDASCWGFYGSPDESGLLDEAKSSIRYEIKQYKERVKVEKERKREMDAFMRVAWAV